MLQHRHLLQAAIILFSLTWKGSLAAADLQYEACRVPKSCGSGPNISYPFYILGLQESYCGYPGFALNCSQDGLPMLNLLDNGYVVRDIDYANSSIRVYDASLSSSSSSGYGQVYSSCQRIFRNTTVPTSLFPYKIGNSNITQLHLFSGCSALSQKINLSSYTVWCNYSGEYISDFLPDCSGVNCTAIQPQLRYGEYADGSIIGIIAMYDKDENLKEAQDKCNTSAVKTVERLKIFPGNYNAATALEETLRSGIELNWTASDCRPCIASGGHCGFDYNFYRFKCFCEGGPHSRSCPIADKHRITRLTLAAGLTAVVVAALIALFLILYIRRKINKRSPARNNKNMELFLKNHGEVAPKRFKYSQLKKMTHKFKDNLGKGGYGSVYKGTLDDGRLVAVKILDQTKGNGDEFLNEVACISRTSHVNIVSLLGFCLEGSRRALVYEYMPNGSLDKFIQDSSSLNWEKLCDIALGIARGLEYLHQGCSTRILHFDIKPHNILLDKDLRPKISDFGLAKLCPERVSIISMSGTRGTIGYIAPELVSRFFGTVSYKSDVYSYGMMMLEMVGERVNNNGRRRERNDCTSSSSDMYFPHWIYKNLEVNFKDDEIDDDECRLIKRKLTIVGLWCIQNDSKDRPSMTKVVEMLEGDVELLQVPPKPYLSSPTRELQDVCTSASGVTSAFDENVI